MTSTQISSLTWAFSSFSTSFYLQYIQGRRRRKKWTIDGKEEKKSQLLFRSTTGSSTVEESGSSGVTESEQAPADKGTDEAAKT